MLMELLVCTTKFIISNVSRVISLQRKNSAPRPSEISHGNDRTCYCATIKFLFPGKHGSFHNKM